MSILSKRFSGEVIGPNGSKTKVSFSGQEAVMNIAFAEVVTPRVAKFCADHEEGNLGEGYFGEEMTAVVAQAMIRLSSEIGTDGKLFSRGVTALIALTESWDRMNQLTFEGLTGVNPRATMFLRGEIQLQKQEEQLGKTRNLLSVFRQLQAKQGQS